MEKFSGIALIVVIRCRSFTVQFDKVHTKRRQVRCVAPNIGVKPRKISRSRDGPVAIQTDVLVTHSANGGDVGPTRRKLTIELKQSIGGVSLLPSFIDYKRIVTSC